MMHHHMLFLDFVNDVQSLGHLALYFYFYFLKWEKIIEVLSWNNSFNLVQKKMKCTAEPESKDSD